MHLCTQSPFFRPRRSKLSTDLFLRKLQKLQVNRKMPSLYCIKYRNLILSWNIVETYSSRRVSGESLETLQKLCVCTKFPHQQIRLNFGILRSALWLFKNGSLWSYSHETKKSYILLEIIVKSIVIAIIITITLFEVAIILANANKNQLTNIKTFVKEKCQENNNKKTQINKNYFLHITHAQSIFPSCFKLVLNSIIDWIIGFWFKNW